MHVYQRFVPHAGRLKYPLALAAASENVAFELAGWRTSTGILLRKPILASLQLTPDIARQVLFHYSYATHKILRATHVLRDVAHQESSELGQCTCLSLK